jgi:hypothetical protein
VEEGRKHTRIWVEIQVEGGAVKGAEDDYEIEYFFKPHLVRFVSLN